MVERRQASAPASGGRRKPPFRGATRAPLACGTVNSASAGVPPPLFFRSPDEASVIREQNRSVEATPDCAPLHPGYGPSLFDIMARQTRAHRAARTTSRIRPRESGGGGPSAGWWRGPLTRRSTFVAGDLSSSRPSHRANARSPFPTSAGRGKMSSLRAPRAIVEQREPS